MGLRQRLHVLSGRALGIMSNYARLSRAATWSMVLCNAERRLRPAVVRGVVGRPGRSVFMDTVFRKANFM